MDGLYKEYVISFFDKTLQMHGDRPEAVRWSEKGQRLRFEDLLSIDSDIRGKKVLDYGCGKGDLYQFLKDKNIPVSYTGFDINDNLISLAKSKFPGAEFRVFDIEEERLNEDFDYIFLCGVFNLKVAGIDETIRNVLKMLFEHCNIALAFNALSDKSLDKDFQLHYVSPEGILQFALNELSPHACITEGGNSDDFTMFVYKKEKNSLVTDKRDSGQANSRPDGAAGMTTRGKISSVPSCPRRRVSMFSKRMDSRLLPRE